MRKQSLPVLTKTERLYEYKEKISKLMLDFSEVPRRKITLPPVKFGDSVIPLYKVERSSIRNIKDPLQQGFINNAMNCVHCMTNSKVKSSPSIFQSYNYFIFLQDYFTVFLPSTLPHHLAVLAIENILENPKSLKNKSRNLRRSVLNFERQSFIAK